jgi:microcystin-dependent protein
MPGTLKVGGNIIASHSGVEGAGEVTLQNAMIGSGVVFPTFVGMIASFAMSSAPSGWIICNGAAYANADYSELYTAIGSQWVTAWTNSESITTGDYRKNSSGVIYIATSTGTTSGTDVGDDVGVTWSASSNFLVPDLRGSFLRGSGTGTINSRNKGGNAVGVFQEDEFQGHYHEFKASHNITYGNTHGYLTVPRHSVSNANFDSQTTWPLANNQSSALVRNPVADLTNGTPRTSTETSPYNASVQYCIKY